MTTLREVIKSYKAAAEEAIWNLPSGHAGDYEMFAKPRPSAFEVGQLWLAHPIISDPYKDCNFQPNYDDLAASEHEWRKKNKCEDAFFVLHDTRDGLRGFLVIPVWNGNFKLADKGDVILEDDESPIRWAFIATWRGSVNLLDKHLVTYFGMVQNAAIEQAFDTHVAEMLGIIPNPTTNLSKSRKSFRDIVWAETECYDLETLAVVLAD